MKLTPRLIARVMVAALLLALAAVHTGGGRPARAQEGCEYFTFEIAPLVRVTCDMEGGGFCGRLIPGNGAWLVGTRAGGVKFCTWG